MACFDEYNSVKMVIPAQQEYVLNSIINRKHELLCVDNSDSSKVDNILLTGVDRLVLKNRKSSDDKLYLLLMEDPASYKWSDGDFNRKLSDIKKNHPEVKQVEMSLGDKLKYIRDKELLFQCSYLATFGGGNVEHGLNERIKKHVFFIKERKDHYMVDDYYDVRVFLRRCDLCGEKDTDHLETADIRDYSINRQLIDKIKEKAFIYEKDKTFLAEYSAESNRIQAQYFISRFYCNPAWNVNPVCIMNYRLSAYVLPGVSRVSSSDKNEQEEYIYNNKNNTRYILDSIHCNYDICYDRRDFNNLIDGQYLNINMA